MSQKNVLNHQQFFAVCQWIEKLAERQKPIVSNYIKLSENASRDLSLPVSASAIKNAVEATKVSFVHSAKRAANLNSDRVQRLSEALLLTINGLEQKFGEKLVADEVRTEIKMLMQRKGRANVEKVD